MKCNRIDRLIVNMQKIKLKRPEIPSYLRHVDSFQERSSSSNVIPPRLARHHLIPGSTLNELLDILRKNRSATLIHILKSLYYNLPTHWRRDRENKDYLHAIQCLDEDVEDKEITEKNIDDFCVGKIETLFSLFYWRPDNIQIGPESRFRDFKNSYDYDCFYLLRGHEMLHSMAFRKIVDEIVAHGTITDKQNKLLLRINENMLSMRNTPRNYIASEWWYLETTRPPNSLECWHTRSSRNIFNVLEKVFDSTESEKKTISRNRKTLDCQNIEKIKAWCRLRFKQSAANYEKYTKVEKTLNKVIVETNPRKFIKQLNKFLYWSEEILDMKVLSQILFIYSTDYSVEAFMIDSHYISYLFAAYLSNWSIDMNDKDKRKNKQMLTIIQILKRTKVTYGDSKGYAVDTLKVLKYNVYFLSLFFSNSQFSIDELLIFKDIDKTNVVKAVEDFNEAHKSKNDDIYDYYKNNLTAWYTFLSHLHKVFHYKFCLWHLRKAIDAIIQCRPLNYL